MPFVAEVSQNAVSPYRIVVLFDGVQTVTAYSVCAKGVGYGPGVTSSASADVVRVHAVLCGADKPLSAVSGQVRGVSGPSDPAFRQLVGQMSILLFPPRKPTAGDRPRGIFTN